ncbi:MAG TPA: hypothetical protein ENN72_03900 [Firmicutes bacterium]|nr:hypothetical protein [Bacillota bacterium]
MKKTCMMISALLLCFAIIQGQNTFAPSLHEALKKEMEYALENLVLEGHALPFYLSAYLTDLHLIRISAEGGSLFLSRDVPYRGVGGRVMVGDYQMNNENFLTYNNLFGEMGRFMGTVRDPHPGAVQRSLWMIYDGLYKEAVAHYENKKSVMKERGVPPGKDGYDFIPGEAVRIMISDRILLPPLEELEERARQLSRIIVEEKSFKESRVDIYAWETLISYVNSEGSFQVYPQAGLVVTVKAYGLTPAGEREGGQLRIVHSPRDPLPPMDDWRQKIRLFSQGLKEKISAEAYEDYYEGPVLFTEEAVAFLFAKSLFGEQDPLIARKRPLYYDMQVASADPESNKGMMERRYERLIISPQLTVKAMPHIDHWEGVSLVGSFPVSAEGVKTKEKLLVSRGILKNVLGNRTPSQEGKEAGWHKRWPNPLQIEDAPGVIVVSCEKEDTPKELYEKMILSAQKNGYDYYLEIASLAEPGYLEPLAELPGEEYGSVIPIRIYKVFDNGKRVPLRRVGGVALSPGTLKRLLGVSGPLQTKNLLFKRKQSDIYASFIVPEQVGVEEMSLSGLPDEGFTYEEYLPRP